MTDKMRSEFEEWAIDNGHSIGKYVNEFHQGEYLSEYTAFAWKAWQAAQSAAVPMVGEVVAWVNPDDKGLLSSVGRVGWYELIEKPTTSITAAELDALRKDAERYRWLRMKGAHSDAVDKVHMLGPQLDAAIDAAIAGEKK